MTIQVSSLAPINVYAETVGGPFATVGGETVAGNIYTIRYDGTEFQLQNVSNGSVSSSDPGSSALYMLGTLL
jgi:hypothetical protein